MLDALQSSMPKIYLLRHPHRTVTESFPHSTVKHASQTISQEATPAFRLTRFARLLKMVMVKESLSSPGGWRPVPYWVMLLTLNLYGFCRLYDPNRSKAYVIQESLSHIPANRSHMRACLRLWCIGH